MQRVPVSWTMDALGRAPHLVRSPLGPDTLAGARQRCPRCDIPLGSHPCPNPQCREPHGQSAGALCSWCAHRLQEPLDGLDIARVHDHEHTVWPRVAARMGGGFGPEGDVPDTARIAEPGHGSRA
jgi:hypothetical protein